MKKLMTFTLLLTSILFNCSGKTQSHMETPVSATSLYDQEFHLHTLMGEEADLNQYKGKIVMIVNTASKCGLTPQYEDLEKLYNTYKDQGFVILGFPANNFLSQEPGTNEEIAAFCQKNYGVSFPMFEKISVKGSDQHPLYQWLTEKEKNGVMDTKVDWNFNKYILDKNGHLVSDINPKTNPMDTEVTDLIKQLL